MRPRIAAATMAESAASAQAGLTGKPCAARAPAPAPDGPDGERRRQGCEDPRPGGAERAADAAEPQEGLVERPDGLPVGQVPGDVAPDQEAAQRDDEGRDGEVAHEPALERADRRAGGEPGKDREGRQRPVAQGEPEEVGQPARLHHGHHGRAGGQQRAHREVDVAGDDHEHHARGHDRHGDGLDREVEHVARREEPPVHDPAGQHVEDQADRDEGADHAEEARVHSPASAGSSGAARRAGRRACRSEPCDLSSKAAGRPPRLASGRAPGGAPRPGGSSGRPGAYCWQTSGASSPETPWQSVSGSIQPASSTTSRFSSVTGTGSRNSAVTSVPPGVV